MPTSRRQLLLAPMALSLFGTARSAESVPAPMNLLGVRVDDVRAAWGEPDRLEGRSHPQAFYRLDSVTIRIPNFREDRMIVYFGVKFPLIEVPFTESRKRAEAFVPADRQPVGFGTAPGGNTRVFRYNSQDLEHALVGLDDTDSGLGWGAGDPGDFTIQPSPYHDRPATVPETFVLVGFPEIFRDG